MSAMNGIKENTYTGISTGIAIGKVHIKQEPYVNEEGIWVPVEEYVPEGFASTYRCVMTKEMFVKAHNKYIKGRRMYKGGWKR